MTSPYGPIRPSIVGKSMREREADHQLVISLCTSTRGLYNNRTHNHDGTIDEAATKGVKYDSATVTREYSAVDLVVPCLVDVNQRCDQIC